MANRWKRTTIVVTAFAVALALRACGIGKESFWYDEACSAKFSDNSIAEVLEDNAKDVHPPLYYIGLHYWRRLWGDSDVRIRAYSLPWSLLGLLAVFLLALGVGRWRVGLIALVLGAVNPHHVFFAQEARMYSQAPALCMFGSWCLWRWMAAVSSSSRPRTWLPWAVAYTFCASGALLTHYLSAFILTSQGLFAIVWFARQRQWPSLAGYGIGTLAVAVVFLPWFAYLMQFRPTLYHPGLNGIKSQPLREYYCFVGCEFFWGNASELYSRWWVPTMIFPLLVLGICLREIMRKGERPTGGEMGDLFPQASQIAITYPLWLLVGPVLLIALAVQFYHPVYVRPRFAPFLLPPFLVLAGIACARLRKKLTMWIVTASVGALMLVGTYVQYQTYQKHDWRQFAKQWRKNPPACVAFFPRVLEIAAEYYLKEPVKQMPEEKPRHHIEASLPPWEGTTVWLSMEPGWSSRCSQSEADYYLWLLSLGTVRRIRSPNLLVIDLLTIDQEARREKKRFDCWYPPYEIQGKITGFEKQYGFHILEFDKATSTPFVWSKSRAQFCLLESEQVSTVVLNAQFAPPAMPHYRPNVRFFTKRSKTALRFSGDPLVAVSEWRPGAFEIQLSAPMGSEPLWVGWTMKGINLERAGVSEDDRDLGLRLNWIGVKSHLVVTTDSH